MENAPFKKDRAKGKFTVNNEHGLYTVPSTEIVKCATSFKSQVYLTYQKKTVNAKSLLSIVLLTASKGAQIRVEAKGEDAEEAVQSIIDLAKNKFYLSY